MEWITMSNYKTPADGRLWVPSDGVGNAHTDAIAEAIDSLDTNEPVVTSNDHRVFVDELYYDNGAIHVSALFDDWFASLKIPLQPSSGFRGVLNDINSAFDVAARESGYYLTNNDVAFVDTFAPDGQGRITVGREYANESLKVIGVRVDD